MPLARLEPERHDFVAAIPRNHPPSPCIIRQPDARCTPAAGAARNSVEPVQGSEDLAAAVPPAVQLHSTNPFVVVIREVPRRVTFAEYARFTEPIGVTLKAN